MSNPSGFGSQDNVQLFAEVSGLALLAAAHQSTAKLLAARDAQLSQIRDNTQAMRRAIEGNSKKMKAALEYDKLKLEGRGAGAAFRASLTACVAAVTEESARVGDAIEVLQTERSAIERVQKASDIFATGEEQTGQVRAKLGCTLTARKHADLHHVQVAFHSVLSMTECHGEHMRKHVFPVHACH